MERKKKIRIMLFNAIIDNGGVATYFKRINKAFNKYDIESQLIYLKDNIEKKYYVEESRYFRSIKFLKENIDKQNPNIIIANHGFETLIAKMAIIWSRKKVRLISIVHIRSVMWVPKYKNKIKGSIFRELIKIAFKVCDKCIAVSEGLRNEIIEEGWIKKNKIEVIYNPVIEDKFKGQVKELKENKQIHMAIIGWIWDIKNQIEAIRAIRVLNDKKYILHIIGGIKDEKYYKKLKEIIKKYGLEKQIIFEGNKEDIFEELKNIDIVLLTSKTEALPTVIIEAIASGTPVIASNCKFGPKEIIEENYGLLYELGNVNQLAGKIELILKDNNLYKNISEKGLIKAEVFRYREIIKKYEEVMRVNDGKNMCI